MKFDFKVLAVVPCLNEAAYIGGIIERLLLETEDLDLHIAVVDGGSADETVRIVSELAARHPQVSLLENPRRIQSAALNLAMASLGSDVRYLIRIDAHAGYPAHYCRDLVEEAERTNADSVVVSMESVGHSRFEQIVASAQNSLIGNGGSAHRNLAEGRWIDHGHHALMRASAFLAVGGYDEGFSHNEDAELDFRLTRAGFRIWLTGRVRIKYFPRSSLASLFRQYFDYGRGRTRNSLKNRAIPRLRQIVPAPLVPLVVLSIVPGMHWLSAGILLWATACITYGFIIAFRTRRAWDSLSGLCAMVMHFAWSLGFWSEIVAQTAGKFRSRVPPIDVGLKTRLP